MACALSIYLSIYLSFYHLGSYLATDKKVHFKLEMDRMVLVTKLSLSEENKILGGIFSQPPIY